MKKRLLFLTAALFTAACLTGCQQKDPEPGDIAGYDEGEEYLSIWVHSIEDTEEGQAYKESVETFNEAYDGKYFADIEFVPRNDSGGGYSDKVNASVMAGGLAGRAYSRRAQHIGLRRQRYYPAAGRPDRGRRK